VIRVRRGDEPAVLADKKEAATSKLREAVGAGECPEFERNLYAAPKVKLALVRSAHGKCAFCETRPQPASAGDVEHFRPKGAWQQQRGDSLNRPAYWWLAYEWSNLLFSCANCNRKKGNLFPLENAKDRVTTGGSVECEQPMIVDPAVDDPADHIRFDREYALRVTEKGQTTIDALGLNRAELLEDRLRKLRFLEIAQRTPGQAAEELIRLMVRETEPYTAMLRANL